MTQPNKPGPSWEKEAVNLAADDWVDSNEPFQGDWHNNQVRSAFLAGARWAQEKAAAKSADAPGEESWEKLQIDEADKYSATHVGLGQRSAFHHGFDAAIELVAKPLLKEVKRLSKKRDEALDTAELGNKCAEILHEELSSLKPENAALREELNKAGATIECKDREISRFRQERHTLRQQLAETLSSLEELADLMDDVRANEYEPDRFTTQPARALLAKLKGASPSVSEAPSDKDAGEGKEECQHLRKHMRGERCMDCGTWVKP